MRILKLLGLVFGCVLLFTMNYFDGRFSKESSPNLSFDLPYIIYGKSTEESKEYLKVKLLTINYEGSVHTFLSRGVTPLDAILRLNLPISMKNRIVSTSPISRLYNNSYILVKSYSTTIEELEILVPYATITKGETLCQKLSEEVVEQEGVLGTMIQKIKKFYEGNSLIAQEVVEETISKNPRPEILIIKGPDDSPLEVPQRGYNCAYWKTYIDNINATEEEKQWLKFTMYGESGCNAESNKSYYKGLFQWDPCIWYEQYPNDNIFDGEAQIRHTLEKVRAGANPARMWPSVYRKYVEKYGELSWLKD